MNDKFVPLEAVYAFHEEFVRGFSAACEKGCSACCTVNVALTTLEADYLLEVFDVPAGGHVEERLRAARALGAYSPTTTLNRNIWQILRGEEVTPDAGEHLEGTCPLLTAEGVCTVYERRPFACRAMSSRSRCLGDGAADMEPFLVTVNLALYQIIEHLDSSGGFTDNLASILAMQGSGAGSHISQAKNCPLPGFMIPPEDKPRFRSFLRRLAAYPAGSATLGAWLPEEMPVY